MEHVTSGNTDVDDLCRVLARYQLHPEDWPEEPHLRERHNTFLPDYEDVAHLVIAPMDKLMARIPTVVRAYFAQALFLRALATANGPIVGALVRHALAAGALGQLRLRLVDMCHMLGLEPAALIASVDALPQDVYHAFTNAVVACLRQGLDAGAIDPTVLLFCAGNPEITRTFTIGFPASDAAATALYFAASTKISVGHLEDAVRALEPDFSFEVLSTCVTRLYYDWITRALSPVRARIDEGQIGALVDAMAERAPPTVLGDVSALLLCRLETWLRGPQSSIFMFASCGVQLEARVFPNMQTLRAHLTDENKWPVHFKPESVSPFALAPSAPVLFVTRLFVPPWFEGARLYGALFTGLEQELAGQRHLTVRAVPLVVVGPLFVDGFYALDTRYGWARMVGSADVHSVCAPRPGDPFREHEFFYWSTPELRARAHLVSTRAAGAPPVLAWHELQGHAHARSLEQVVRRLALELAGEVGAPVCQVQDGAITCIIKRRATRAIVKDIALGVPHGGWYDALLSTLVNFFVDACRVWAVELRIEDAALETLAPRILNGSIWKPAAERPLPWFTGYRGSLAWWPGPRAPSAVRPPPASEEGEGESLWVRQRRADLAHPPRAGKRPAFESKPLLF